MALTTVLATSDDQLRWVTSSAAGPWGCFQLGQTIFVPAGVQVPHTLLVNSEPISLLMRTPETKIFDQAAFERYEARSNPRPEPDPEWMMSAVDIMKRFDLTEEQFREAQAAG